VRRRNVRQQQWHRTWWLLPENTIETWAKLYERM
jgi:hypothetical protein